MSQISADRVDTYKRMAVLLLDRGYVQATQQTIDAIVRNGASGALAVRLQQLEAEAARLADLGEKFGADNPVVRALLADFETTLRRDAALVDAGSTAVQESAQTAAAALTRQLALPGTSDQQLAAIGVAWNQPDPEMLAALVNLANKPAWQAMIDTYQKGVGDVANNIILRGLAEGWGPARTARELRGVMTELPVAQANTLLRTTQLTVYRQATAANQLANSDILEEQIRIATLDDRTCIACIALHGTHLALGEVVDDHWNGRCTSIGVVKGIPRDVQTGEDWFGGLPEDRQRTILGDSAFDAYQSGKVTLQDFVDHTHDDVFGPMVREASLKSLGISSRGAVPPDSQSGAPAPAPAGPQGKPVSDALTLSATKLKKLGPEAARSLGLIDDVHGDGALTSIPIVNSRNKSFYGAYYSAPSGKPVKIALSSATLNSKTDHVAATLIHEVGHFLDHQGMGSAGQWQSVRAVANVGPLADWWTAVKQSPEYQLLTRAAAEPSTYNVSGTYARYLVSPKEVWARAYTQYIATRTTDATVTGTIEQDRQDTTYGKMKVWSDESFQPIAEQMDKAFTSLGWMQ